VLDNLAASRGADGEVLDGWGVYGRHEGIGLIVALKTSLWLSLTQAWKQAWFEGMGWWIRGGMEWRGELLWEGLVWGWAGDKNP
jgi:hypothetical protein